MKGSTGFQTCDRCGKPSYQSKRDAFECGWCFKRDDAGTRAQQRLEALERELEAAHRTIDELTYLLQHDHTAGEA